MGLTGAKWQVLWTVNYLIYILLLSISASATLTEVKSELSAALKARQAQTVQWL